MSTQPASAPSIGPTASRLILLGLWGAATIFMLVQNWAFISTLNFRDPDDAMRFVQVRDLLAGQNWFDLTQYRLNPPHGVPMHWSRLVDLPLALGILAMQSIFGADLGQRIALAGIPPLYLLGLFFIVRALCRRLGLAESTALLAAVLLATSVTLLVQCAPMRIDHHGPQVFYGALALLALVATDRHGGLMGLLAGIAMACWMQVSMEGLPYAVAMGGIFALRFLWRADGWADMRAYVPALTGASALLLLGTHGWQGSLVFWCDAMSPAYLLPLIAVSAVLLIAGHVMPRHSPLQRAMPLIFAGTAGLAFYLATSRQCLAGPFATLDPLVHELWYKNVLEGMPIDRQTPDMQLIILLPALLGLAGSAIGLRHAQSEDRRIAWGSLLLIQIFALAIAVNVMRAMTFAHLVALPGNAVLLAALMGAAQRLSLRPLRVPLTAAVALLTPFGAATATIALVDTAVNKPKATDSRYNCTVPKRLAGLNALPKATLFTPIDIGSHLLAYTSHSLTATGHHRNLEGMKAVVHAFAGGPAEARTIVTASSATYLAFCAGETEAIRFKTSYPHGLMALLMRGQQPDWLVPVPMRPGETIKVYRIVRPVA